VAGSGTLARPRRHAASAPARRSSGIALVLAGCLALAALSLLGPSAPTYDPWAWLNWGRQISEGGLDTVAGPSWKPLPVAFTAAFSLVDQAAAPSLWLLVARAGGLLGIAMSFRLADRLAGPAAGAIAAASLILANGFVSSFARGNSEGLLVGLVLWAIESHLDGRRRSAFLLGAAAGLLRPEVWPFLAAYGVWLIHAERREGGSGRQAVALCAGAAVAFALLWFVPEYIGSGSFFRAATRARDAVPGSPGQADHPFFAVFGNSTSALIVPVYAGAVLAVVFAARAWRRGRGQGVELGLAALTAAYMVIVGLLAEGGFTGNLRYVTLPAAVVCVLAGVGWVRLVSWARATPGRAPAALAAVAMLAAVPWTVEGVAELRRDLDRVRITAELSDDLPKLIDAAGGRRAVQRCGRVFTGPLEVQLVAWHLHVASRHIDFRPRPPGVVLAAEGVRVTDDPRFKPVAASAHWTMRSTCG